MKFYYIRKLTQFEKEKEYLTYKNQEEIKVIEEKFCIFSKICIKYIMKLRNIYKIFSRIEEKNIKSMLNNKGKIFIDINTILNEFEGLVNDTKLIEDINNKKIDEKFYEVFGKNDEEQILKMFNFIDIISKLENNNKLFLDKYKHEVKKL
jgi:hypothetical protein